MRHEYCGGACEFNEAGTCVAPHHYPDAAPITSDFLCPNRQSPTYIRLDIHEAVVADCAKWKAKAEQAELVGLAKASKCIYPSHAQLSDTCGTLRTANMELLAENAQLRRKIEKLERQK